MYQGPRGGEPALAGSRCGGRAGRDAPARARGARTRASGRPSHDSRSARTFSSTCGSAVRLSSPQARASCLTSLIRMECLISWMRGLSAHGAQARGAGARPEAGRRASCRSPSRRRG